MTLQHQLSNFLLTYRSTPHATTNQSPCSLFLKREVRTRFDLMKPDSQGLVTGKQGQQKLAHDQKAKLRELTIGQDVMARNYRAGDKWMPGTVIGRRGPLSYTVQMKTGAIWRRHIDQLREHIARADVNSDPTSSDEVASPSCDFGGSSGDDVPENTPVPESDTEGDTQVDAPTEEPTDETDETPVVEPVAPQASGSMTRYPTRVRKPPDMYGYEPANSYDKCK